MSLFIEKVYKNFVFLKYSNNIFLHLILIFLLYIFFYNFKFSFHFEIFNPMSNLLMMFKVNVVFLDIYFLNFSFCLRLTALEYKLAAVTFNNCVLKIFWFLRIYIFCFIIVLLMHRKLNIRKIKTMIYVELYYNFWRTNIQKKKPMMIKIK